MSEDLNYQGIIVGLQLENELLKWKLKQQQAISIEWPNFQPILRWLRSPQSVPYIIMAMYLAFMIAEFTMRRIEHHD